MPGLKVTDRIPGTDHKCPNSVNKFINDFFLYDLMKSFRKSQQRPDKKAVVKFINIIFMRKKFWKERFLYYGFF